MSKGVISEIWKTKNGFQGRIKSDEFPRDPKFKVPKGNETKYVKGTAVEFKAEEDNRNKGGFFAYSVCLADKGFFLPKDTSDLLTGFKVQNAALFTQKYIPRKNYQLKIDKPWSYSTKEEKSLQNSLPLFQQQVLADYKGNHYCVTGSLGSRMAIGLGDNSVFETSIALHHTYAVPYIRGQVVKGCLRSFIIRDIFKSQEDEAINDGCFADIFGSKKKSGKIIFLDAFPRSCDKLEIDIINSHFSDYYSGTSAPLDSLKTSLVNFYAVPAGTEFVFRVCSRKLDIKKTFIDGKNLCDLFKEMLSEIGIGAKTAVGYGWFRNLKENK